MRSDHVTTCWPIRRKAGAGSLMGIRAAIGFVGGYVDPRRTAIEEGDP